MTQKRVSFEVARALKEAGYPQDKETLVYLTAPCCGVNPGNIASLKVMSLYDVGNNFVAAPSYIDAWLWLWREKGIMVDTSQIGGKVDAEVYTSDEEVLYVGNELHDDPEEAITKAIDCLVENKLLK